MGIAIVVAGVVVAIVGLVVPGVPTRTRWQGIGGGTFFIAYGIWVANQTTGIILIPAGLFGIAGLAIVALVAMPVLRAREQQRRRSNPPLPPGTPGAKQCLRCGKAFPAETTGACPHCRGTLARTSSATKPRE